MMFAGGTGAPARESPIQQSQARNQVHLHPSPVRKPATAGATHLIPEQLDHAVMHSIIVRLNDAALLEINELHQALLLDRCPQQLIHVWPSTFPCRHPSYSQ